MSLVENSRETILIVDDSPNNLTVLSQTLSVMGWEISIATDGEMAIEQAQYALPDLILLDVLMSGIDGFETCRRLKANPITKEIPVIFMTALSDVTHKVDGFAVGAVDFISKPFHAQELFARVKVHLELRSLNQKLESQNKELLKEISDRKQTEAALRESEARFRSIFENAAVGINLADRSGQFIQVNQTFCGLLGYTKSEFLQLTCWDVSHPDDLVHLKDSHAKLFAKEIDHYQAEKRYFHKNGEIIWALVTFSLVCDPDGNPISDIAVVEDIRDRKQAEAAILQKNQELEQTLAQLQNTQTELVQSEKMAVLGQLVAGVAHEINTTLGVIQSSVKNVDVAIARSLQNLPKIMQQMPAERWTDFLSLLNSVKKTQYSLSFREERHLKRQLIEALDKQAIANAEILGDYLSRMHISQDLSPLIPLLQEKNNAFIVETAYEFLVIETNTKNIMLAAEQATKIVFALKSYSHYNNSDTMTLASVTDGINIVLTIYQNLLRQDIEVKKTFNDVPKILCYPEELNQVWTNLIHPRHPSHGWRG